MRRSCASSAHRARRTGVKSWLSVGAEALAGGVVATSAVSWICCQDKRSGRRGSRSSSSASATGDYSEFLGAVV